MNLSEALLGELQNESAKTRKYLELVQKEHLQFKPHPKSMSMEHLTGHIAELGGWLYYTIEFPELDFATMDYKPPVVEDNAALMKLFEENLEKGRDALQNASNEKLMENWTLRNGEHIFFTLPKIQVLRDVVFNHLVHHRGQLSVYLRLLDIKLPGIYGPSADEMEAQAQGQEQMQEEAAAV